MHTLQTWGLLLCIGRCVASSKRLRLWPIANHASNVLLPHFIKTGPDRPLWEANPMDAQVIHRPHVEVGNMKLKVAHNRWQD
eukprot:1149529-Pelagomonas_calceolata.AAC.8